MATGSTSARGDSTMREAPQDEDPSEQSQVVWASIAQKRRGGQIGDGLLHRIEDRLGSIA